VTHESREGNYLTFKFSSAGAGFAFLIVIYITLVVWFTKSPTFRCHQTQFQDVKYHQNVTAAGAAPRTPLGKLTADPLAHLKKLLHGMEGMKRMEGKEREGR